MLLCLLLGLPGSLVVPGEVVDLAVELAVELAVDLQVGMWPVRHPVSIHSTQLACQLMLLGISKQRWITNLSPRPC